MQLYGQYGYFPLWIWTLDLDCKSDVHTLKLPCDNNKSSDWFYNDSTMSRNNTKVFDSSLLLLNTIGMDMSSLV